VLALTLLAPSRLWLLALVAGAAVAYAVLQRRRRHPAVRHPDVALVAAVAPRGAAWRRHLGALALGVALVAVVVGLARPARAEAVPREDAVVVLAVDTSLSMTATDIAPDRLTAAVAAATDFVERAPDGYRIGLVGFGETATTLAPPTTDHAAVVAALERIEPGPGTAAGDGLAAAVDLVDAADDVAVVTGDDTTYRAVVLLADGASEVGLPLGSAAARAAEAEVPVFTVAYGTDTGTIDVDGVATAVPADPEAMAAVAEATDGATYTATTAEELVAVYQRIGTRIGWVTETVELVTPVALLAAAALALAFVAGLAWTPRLT
jgi:Ca-activated chloride channel family protein